MSNDDDVVPSQIDQLAALSRVAKICRGQRHDWPRPWAEDDDEVPGRTVTIEARDRRGEPIARTIVWECGGDRFDGQGNPRPTCGVFRTLYQEWDNVNGQWHGSAYTYKYTKPYLLKNGRHRPAERADPDEKYTLLWQVILPSRKW